MPIAPIEERDQPGQPWPIELEDLARDYVRFVSSVNYVYGITSTDRATLLAESGWAAAIAQALNAFKEAEAAKEQQP